MLSVVFSKDSPLREIYHVVHCYIYPVQFDKNIRHAQRKNQLPCTIFQGQGHKYISIIFNVIAKRVILEC